MLGPYTDYSPSLIWTHEQRGSDHNIKCNNGETKKHYIAKKI